MFSILTPTYNREHTLQRVLSSLRKQKYSNFEWIIIDDASTDNTAKLVATWQKLNLPFNIIYRVLPENKGKPNALNVGLEFCSREITIIADSDDEFVPETLQELKQLWDLINLSDNSNKIAAIWTLVKDDLNNLVGDVFPSNFWQVNLKQRVLANRQKVIGEKWHCWRTTILKEHKMFHSENSFISESSTWNRINKNYDFLCVNISYRIYHSSPDGYIQSKKTRLELEKLKFYNSYYQLYETTVYDILKYTFYHHYAFDYIKSKTVFSDPNLKLGFKKTLACTFLTIITIPKRVLSYYKSIS